MFFQKMNSLRVKKSTKHHVKYLMFETLDLLLFYINSSNQALDLTYGVSEKVRTHSEKDVLTFSDICWT